MCLPTVNMNLVQTCWLSVGVSEQSCACPIFQRPFNTQKLEDTCLHKRDAPSMLRAYTSAHAISQRWEIFRHQHIPTNTSTSLQTPYRHPTDTSTSLQTQAHLRCNMGSRAAPKHAVDACARAMLPAAGSAWPVQDLEARNTRGGRRALLVGVDP